MRTIDSVMDELTNVQKLINDVKETLRTVDPDFSSLEAEFQQASAHFLEAVGNRVTPSAQEYLDALELDFVSSVIYIAGQGFKLNLDIFHTPAASLFLMRGEFEDINRERMLGAVPGVQKAGKTIGAFHDAVRKLPESDKIWEIATGIIDLYAYLETVGYKLAHYFGFVLADRFLPYVIPGYQCDTMNTDRYRRILSNYLELDLHKLFCIDVQPYTW